MGWWATLVIQYLVITCLHVQEYRFGGQPAVDGMEGLVENVQGGNRWPGRGGRRPTHSLTACLNTAASVLPLRRYRVQSLESKPPQAKLPTPSPPPPPPPPASLSIFPSAAPCSTAAADPTAVPAGGFCSRACNVPAWLAIPASGAVPVKPAIPAAAVAASCTAVPAETAVPAAACRTTSSCVSSGCWVPFACCWVASRVSQCFSQAPGGRRAA